MLKNNCLKVSLIWTQDMTFWKGKCLMVQFASEYIFFYFPIYVLNLYFSLSQPTCFPFSFAVQPLSWRSLFLLAIIKADVLYKGGKTDCFKLHKLSSLTEKTGVVRAKFCMSLTGKTTHRRARQEEYCWCQPLLLPELCDQRLWSIS